MHVRIAWKIYDHQQKNGQATSQLSNAPSAASKGFIQGPPPSQGRSSSSSDHTPKQEVTSKNRPSSSTGSVGPSPSSTPTNRDLSGVFPNLMPPSAHGNFRSLTFFVNTCCASSEDSLSIATPTAQSKAHELLFLSLRFATTSIRTAQH